MKKFFYRLSLLSASLFLAFVTIMLISMIAVRGWSYTEAGKVPPKTAVLLHAVHNNLVPGELKAPSIFANKGSSNFTRTDQMIPVSDGGEIPIRLYQPKAEGPHPVVMYYHGGAFMEGFGSIETHDNIIRALAARTDAIVVAPSYRLAPDNPFPTATQDSYDALKWVHEHAKVLGADPNRLAVAGDSAGGNLATVVAMMARDFNGPNIVAEALLYPLTTFEDQTFVSRDMYSSGYYLLSRGVMERAREAYTPQEEMWHSPYTSPLAAADLSNMPPTLLITAQFDPLRDEGEAYGVKLAESGVPVQAIRYDGVMHGFVSFYEVMDRGGHGLAVTSEYLRQAFNGELDESGGHEQLVYNHDDFQNSWQEELEAYAIGAFLIGKQIQNYIMDEQ
ncbi:alpha/beta hydrolase [Shouchella shacheensis]|uniref:alpha/beta hydrolase n=1 Tax=Shouchella shacheensis TaxID=1649580 RepID=UPI000B29AA18|nr:alpha/beta hydrolase [Shouchella shacheensis]